MEKITMSCPCGCSTVLIYEKVKVRILPKVFTYDYQQITFCENEKVLSTRQ
jgi:hypothetical protein